MHTGRQNSNWMHKKKLKQTGRRAWGDASSLMHSLSETQTRGDREKDRHRERGSEREQHTDKASSRRGPVAHPELEKQTEGSLRHTDVTLPVDWQKYM